MRIAKQDVPVRIDVPGATARQVKDFGDATGYGKIGGEYFSSVFEYYLDITRGRLNRFYGSTNREQLIRSRADES